MRVVGEKQRPKTRLLARNRNVTGRDRFIRAENID
jgi:hypothetical protein